MVVYGSCFRADAKRLQSAEATPLLLQQIRDALLVGGIVYDDESKALWVQSGMRFMRASECQASSSYFRCIGAAGAVNKLDQTRPIGGRVDGNRRQGRTMINMDTETKKAEFFA